MAKMSSQQTVLNTKPKSSVVMETFMKQSSLNTRRLVNGDNNKALPWLRRL